MDPDPMDELYGDPEDVILDYTAEELNREACEFCGSTCDADGESPCLGCRAILHDFWFEGQA
ncbi:hypothetical protein AAVH_08896 [Aphelenchoides avenae]|nr:hypothetical protein AAVH_08896 [Aphelenchus avenae]